MSSYTLFLLLHLLMAFVFVGAVFFEVLILEGARRHVSPRVMTAIEIGIGRRATRVMPWVILTLYGSGIAMAWNYRAALAHPLDSTFGLRLTIKISLALSVLGHFLTAMVLRHRGRLVATVFHRIHVSLFFHMVGIVLLAKLMFHLSL